MPTNSLSDVIQHLHRAALGRNGAGLTDGQLLERYVSRCDEAAIKALVQRHGPMVWGVCRRVLGNHHDAEDAFQATFLVLVRKAASVVPREMVAGWLYGVAHQTAHKARATAAKRMAREKQVTQMSEPVAKNQDSWIDLQPVLDDELSRLPDKYRLPIVLCDLEGKSIKEATNHLGWPQGTLAGRLARARKMLGKRLAQRGLVLSAEALAVVLLENAASAAVPTRLLATTLKAVGVFATGQEATSGAISIKVAALAEGVVQGMWVSKVKLALMVLLGFSLIGAGAGLAAKQTQTAPNEQQAPATVDVSPPKESQEKKNRADKYGDPLSDGAVARLGTQRFRHDGNARALAYSVDGKTLVGSTNSGVFFWDAATGKELKRLAVGGMIGSPFDWAGGIDISPDRTTLALGEYFPDKDSGTNTAKVSLWELRGGKQIGTLCLPQGEGEGAYFNRICFTPDGKSLALSFTKTTTNLDNSVSFDFGKVIVFDVASGKVRMSVGEDRALFYNFAVSPDGKTLAVAVNPNAPDKLNPIDPKESVQLRDMATGKLIGKIHDFPARNINSQIHTMAFSPDGKMLAFGSPDQILLFSPATGKMLRHLEAKTGQSPFAGRIGPAVGLVFTPDGKNLISWGVWYLDKERKNKVLIWDVVTGNVLHILDAPVDLNGAMALAPDGKTVAIGTGGSNVQFWDIVKGKKHFTEHQDHYSQIACLAYSPDGKTLASSCDSRTILWDTATNQRTGILPGSSPTLSFSPDGKKLATVARNLDDNKVHVWTVATNKEAMVITLPDDGDGTDVTSAIFSPDGRKLFTLDSPIGSVDAREASSLRHWDADSGKQIQVWNIPKEITPASISPDGKTVLGFLANGALSIYDAEAGKNRLLRNQEIEMLSLTLSPDARVLASGFGGENPGVRLWEVISGKEILSLKCLQIAVSTAAWSPDGRLIATGDYRDGREKPTTTQMVRLWDAATGKELARFGGFKSNVTALAYESNGKSLAVGLADSTISVLDVFKANPKLAPAKADKEALELCWTDLSADDASKAHQALGVLVGAPKQSVPFLQGRLQPVGRVNPDKIQEWIAAQGSEKFATRQAAAKELEKIGGQIKPPIQKALTGNITLETRRRLEQIVINLPDIPGPDIVRTIRAIMVLERIGSPEAQGILKTLARGAPGARETEEAKASLERLIQRAGKIP